MTTAPPVQNPTPNTTVAGKIALAALALTVVGWLIYIEFTGGLDFNVYRLGAMTIFDNEGMHKDLYARDLLDYGALKLPFTYPPFAALLFMPFAFLPFGVGVGIMYTISIGWWPGGWPTLIYDYATSRGYHSPSRTARQIRYYCRAHLHHHPLRAVAARACAGAGEPHYPHPGAG